ncbi:MAG: polyprenyl diphosphate synthase [Buchnera aphidicola (Brevicoryne brassicae)]|uniref:Ditrans,polycis-undecaprenyl-diphosphate synthase ((2E,6E)-farnesyl-diphosphate specific) n=1 Tax=Buchnera aphidicola (Brevicoryne brassicae) TaxID=911343 RepID=A0AAJ5PV31_9GAMM|nr:polyprenyl diphosphate synthase [Buchnera aphidicola]QCI19806.1 di-trans,poly-cis-decaprenylcistransferase [Buchnera aphidicola (Brevicoryne brassicae)]WAI19181.1 MAG: polyprenyl diphosphate synthase [Buchnera aphidicola (Brevicoryne brassicae)]
MFHKFSLKCKEKFKKENLHHVAIIMDGNRRWAKKKGIMCFLGHKEGFKALKKAVKFAIMNNIEILTLYAFSSENRNRPVLEVNALMELFLFALNNEINNLQRYNIQLKIIGDITYFNNNLQKKIIQVEKITLKNSGLILNIAANYGGRWDIIQSVKKIIEKVQKGILKVEQIKESTLSKHLSTSHLSPVDLVIRTGGEKRISNFLLWQIAYSEFYFTDVLWPDFNQYIFQNAIDFFISRERRFGGSKK